MVDMMEITDGILAGEEAVQVLVSGGQPDPEALERWVDAMEALRQGIRDGKMYAGWLRPTEEDVGAGRQLAQLVRNGAPREVIAEAARRVARVTADPQALTQLRAVLAWLVGGSSAVLEGAMVAMGVAMGTGEPDLWKLQRWADGLEVFRRRLAGMKEAGLLRPTEEDVSAARRLVQLVRDGASRDAVVEAAWRVFDRVGDAETLGKLRTTVATLDDVVTTQLFFEVARRNEDVLAALGEGIALFERGSEVAGFVPTAEDLARLRRLRDLVAADGEQALAERRALAKEVWARLPQYERETAI